MNLIADKLKDRMAASGADAESLAAAIARPGLKQAHAGSAVRNWLGGRDHPRAKAEDVRALAGALGCQPKDISCFRSRARFVRSSARKARLVADMIRGKRVDEALLALQFSDKRAGDMVAKALKTAIADAEGADADVTRLYVSESRVDGGPIIKRFQPKDRGRAHPIRKRTSHIVVAVEEAG